MKAFLLSIVFLVSFLIISQATVLQPVFAQSALEKAQDRLGDIGTATGFQTAESSNATIYDRIATIINIILSFVGIFATIYIIVGGIKWMASNGNEEKVKDAKNNIKSAIIGVAIVLVSFFVVNFVVVKIIEIAQ